MEKVIIDKMRHTIIVEKSNGNDVVKGSKFYCGFCGNVLGEAKKKMTFPFSVETFKTSLKNKTFDTMLFGLHHKTCGHTMFSFKKGYGFTKLETYLAQMPNRSTKD
jgi:hypothetical protein